MQKQRNNHRWEFLVCGMVLFLLGACTQAPPPCQVPSAKDSSGEAVSRGSWQAPEFATPVPEVQCAADSIRVETPITRDNSCRPEGMAPFDFRRLETCVDSLLSAGDTLAVVPLLKLVVNPQNNMDEQGQMALRLAKLLHHLHRDAEAGTVLESFMVYKPSVLAWMDSAEALDGRMRQEALSLSLQYQSLVKQISNLMAAKADYRLIRSMTDSLRSCPIPDSLRAWSRAQDVQAEARAVQKVRPEAELVRRLVWDLAAYDSAHAILAGLQEYPSGIQQALRLDTLARWVSEQEAKDKADHDASFWKKRRPEDVLAEARKLRAAGNFAQALPLLNKLLQTPLRKEARKELADVGDALCNVERQKAADWFGHYRKSHQDKDLDNALSSLDRCLEAYPDNPQRAKIQQNRDLLLQEKDNSSARTP